MRTHVIKFDTIEFYAKNNAGSRMHFQQWKNKVKQADWNKPADIIETFPSSADLLGGGSNRVVFDISDNYRMIGEYLVGKKTFHLYICWIGTHAEYDKVCRSNRQYDIKVY